MFFHPLILGKRNRIVGFWVLGAMLAFSLEHLLNNTICIMELCCMCRIIEDQPRTHLHTNMMAFCDGIRILGRDYGFNYRRHWLLWRWQLHCKCHNIISPEKWLWRVVNLPGELPQPGSNVIVIHINSIAIINGQLKQMLLNDIKKYPF